MTDTELLDRAEKLLDELSTRLHGIPPIKSNEWIARCGCNTCSTIRAIDAWKRDKVALGVEALALEDKCPDCALPKAHCICGDETQ